MLINMGPSPPPPPPSSTPVVHIQSSLVPRSSSHQSGAAAGGGRGAVIIPASHAKCCGRAVARAFGVRSIFLRRSPIKQEPNQPDDSQIKIEKIE